MSASQDTEDFSRTCSWGRGSQYFREAFLLKYTVEIHSIRIFKDVDADSPLAAAVHVKSVTPAPTPSEIKEQRTLIFEASNNILAVLEIFKPTTTTSARPFENPFLRQP